MQKPRPNILLLMSDEHAPQSCSAYSPGGPSTPALEQLAEEGTLYENAYCNAPICVPSRLSMFAGRYAWNLRALSNQSRVPGDAPSLQGMLSAAGYDTCAIGKMHFLGDPMWGFDERPYGDIAGLSHQPDPIDTAPAHQLHPGGPAEIPEEAMQETIVVRLTNEFLRARRGAASPFFLVASFNKPHFPLRPPARWFDHYFPDHVTLPLLPDDHPSELHPWMRHHQRFYMPEPIDDDTTLRSRAGYFGNVSFVDELIAQILECLDSEGLAEDTVVIYLSDHGESAGEHGLWRKSNFYEEAVRVPLIIRWPGGQRSKRLSHVVELVDVFPTLLELAGLPAPANIDGESLLSLAEGRVRWKDFALSDYHSHSVPGPMRMIRRGDWKFCWYIGSRPSLFNLRDDPHERRDLHGTDQTVAQVETDLLSVLQRDFDTAEALRRFRYAPNLRWLQVHAPTRTPNQMLAPDGRYVDVEDFYGDTDWSTWSLSRGLGSDGDEEAEV